MIRNLTTSTNTLNASHVQLRLPVSRLTMAAALLVCHPAHAAVYEDINLASCNTNERTFASKVGEPLAATYGVSGAAGNVFIDLSPADNCTGASPTLSCLAGLVSVKAPTPKDAGVPASSKVTMASSSAFAAGDVGKEAKWSTTASGAPSGTTPCTQNYRFHVTSDGGGWGDPHLVTVDGVHYDFQSAGEFTALRQKGLEIQTRQTPVPTATVPISNPYTGITHCVAIYTAVAAKLGSSRITLQPGLASGEADAKGMQLRVNGTLTELTDNAVVLASAEARSGVAARKGTFDGVIRKAAGGAIEITDAGGTQLVVTPAFWDSQRLWYLNVNVYQTSATQGTMGKIAPGSWLPAMPDGSSLGPKPDSENQRYQDLYKKFADGWRVTDATSLFDYAQGQNTATFKRDEWPRNHPQTCGIQGQTSVQGTTAEAAAQACSGVTNAAQKADCQFDVAITGNTGFGKSYEVMQGFRPIGTGWVNVAPGGAAGPVAPWWKAWWWVILLILLLIAVLAWWVSRRSSTP